MDPRMDIGVLNDPDPNTHPPLDTTQSLTPAEVVAIIDLSLSCETTWYTGQLLAQTLFVSTYLRHLDELKRHPDTIVKNVLRSYLLGLIKCCGIVLDEMLKGNLYENEDINTDHHRFDFYDEISVTEALDELDQAHHMVECWPDDAEGCRVGLMERLRFRIEYLYSLARLSSSPSLPTVSHLQDHLSSAFEALAPLQRCPAPTTAMSFTAQTIKVRSAFDLNFCRTVSSHSPPRPVQFFESFEDVQLMARRLLEDLMLISQVALGSSVPDWMSFFSVFSRRVPMPLPLVRSYLMSLFQSGNVIAMNPDRTLMWFARECILNYTMGRVRIESNGGGVRYILNRLAGLLVNYLSAFTANRARGRRLLSRSLKEWRSLYHATLANPLEISPDSTLALQTLIYYFWVDSNLQSTLMGFDLDLYEEAEDRVGMWWVVCRLSERACLLLRTLAPGHESLDFRITKVIGSLARAAIEVVRRRQKHLRPTRAIFDRRIKYMTARESHFDQTGLVCQLGIDQESDLICYDKFMTDLGIMIDKWGVDLGNVREELGRILDCAVKSKKIGAEGFGLYLKTMMESTEYLVNERKWQDGGHEVDENNNHETMFEKLEISSTYHGQDRVRDVADKWFIV